jgi:4-amino-4-deoxy-L-arabinose transferase-like glycosyltransferase
MADPLIGAVTDVRHTPDELFYEGHILLPNGWFPKFPPGWPLVLSLGYLVSARWLLNPLFGLVQLIAIAAIGRRAFSWEVGAVAVFFGILSPFFLVNSIGMMSHALCALLAAAACLAMFNGLARGSLWYYAGMFACLAAALQVRPYTGFVLAFVMTVAALWLNRENQAALMQVFGIGVGFGIIALAGVLFYNHTYTGNWMVSPYAMAAGAKTPPELSFSPARIWRGIRHYGRQTTQESLIGAFPFVYLLAGYALLHEKNRRKEIWILACFYLALVLAYLAHRYGSGVFFGERFHFEGFFAVLLLAARGLDILVERWRTQRWALIWSMLLLAAMQGALQATTVTVVARRGEPYRKIREAVTASGVFGLVLLHDSAGFVAKHFNLNEADWRHASRIYLVDAEPDRRGEWACEYGTPVWTMVSYDARSHRAILANGKAECGGK